LCFSHTCGCESALIMLALAAGPGSRVQRQLYSLLCTLLKAIPALRDGSGNLQQQLCETVAYAAAALLDGAAAKDQQQPQPDTAGESAAAAVAALPSLFVLGRSWLYCAELLQNIPALIHVHCRVAATARFKCPAAATASFT
jgi:hypothetical protein